MKRQAKNFNIILLVSLVSSLMLIAMHTFSTPAYADGPNLEEKTWEGHIWSRTPIASKTFEAPEGATKVKVVARWGWSGSPKPKQNNEVHEVRLPNGHTIRCDDYGDEELDGQWLTCGSTTFDRATDLKIDVVFTGDNSSSGSHFFQVTLVWYGDPTPPPCNINITPSTGPAPLMVKAVGKQSQTINWGDGSQADIVTDQASIQHEYTEPGHYIVTVNNDESSQTCQAEVEVLPPTCMPLAVSPGKGKAPLNVKASAGKGRFDKIDWDDDNSQNGSDSDGEHTYTKAGRYQVTAWINNNGLQTLACANVLVEEKSIPTTGQYQDFIGAVAFGTFTPYLEPGKEYFDMTRSIMYNVEYIYGNLGEIVYRFNGQEVDNVVSSIFHAETYNQVESEGGRVNSTFKNGVTKLIAYRYGQEQARIYQTVSLTNTRWIHPLDQPFEHKYEFELELHGPANATDLLIYGDEQREIQYDDNGITTVELDYSQPGLVALYSTTNNENWITIATTTFPITTSQSVSYDFGETGLYHYQILDAKGQVVAGPQPNAHIEFEAVPGVTYQAQLIYPATSIFVGLYDDMKFHHPDYWTMPIDGRFEHDQEFHLDYHRQNDPDLDNDHIRGDVIIDALYLINGTTSVAQQFPYGRHDGALPGVTIVGIPDVSMIAFCQRPGVHEVVYWGGWENESYYLPDRGWIFDQELFDRWTEDQRGDCIDAAQRVNQTLAREGLRTDHTFRHHSERSQGYQMVQSNIWSPYNLVGMHPPHIGRFLKPGTVLPYYQEVEDTLFWGWDLDKGGLADGVDAETLQQYINSLGPVIYSDQTGIHPAAALN